MLANVVLAKEQYNSFIHGVHFSNTGNWFKVMFVPSFSPELSHPHTITQLVG
jgi:hypothetical protein